MSLVSQIAPSGGTLTEEQILSVVDGACAGREWAGKKVLLIIPDSTRTAPVGPVFKALYRRIAGETAAVDVMVALGTHPPMTQEAICHRLELSPEERAGEFSRPQFLNHEWTTPRRCVRSA